MNLHLEALQPSLQQSGALPPLLGLLLLSVSPTVVLVVHGRLERLGGLRGVGVTDVSDVTDVVDARHLTDRPRRSRRSRCAGSDAGTVLRVPKGRHTPAPAVTSSLHKSVHVINNRSEAVKGI